MFFVNQDTSFYMYRTLPLRHGSRREGLLSGHLSRLRHVFLRCSPVRDMEALFKWMRLLCTELAHRIGVDRKAWNRRATKLTLQVISLNSGSRCARTPRKAFAHTGDKFPVSADLSKHCRCGLKQTERVSGVTMLLLARCGAGDACSVIQSSSAMPALGHVPHGGRRLQ